MISKEKKRNERKEEKGILVCKMGEYPIIRPNTIKKKKNLVQESPYLP